MNTTNSHYQSHITPLKTSEAKQASSKQDISVKRLTVPTWLTELGREVFVWGLIYATTIGFIFLFRLLTSRIGY